MFVVSTMPHATDTEYQYIELKQLAPTFAAEVSGVDFSKPVEKNVFDEILKAITTVSLANHPAIKIQATLLDCQCIQCRVAVLVCFPCRG